jgi:anti-anti-sigma factor
MQQAKRFRVRVVATQHVAFVVLGGELDLAAVAGFEGVFEALLGSGPAEVGVDLDALAFIDAKGLDALLRARRLGRSSGLRMGFVRPSEACRRALRVTRLEHLVDSAEAALVGG